MAQAWFPGGPTDPRLALLRVTVEHGEYWDAAGRVVPFLSMLKAAVTHTEPRHAGEHREFGG
jgi:general stress protein 26